MTVESHDSLCVANVKGFKNGDDIRPKQNDEDLRERSNLDLSNDLKEGLEQSIRSTQGNACFDRYLLNLFIFKNYFKVCVLFINHSTTRK